MGARRITSGAVVGAALLGTLLAVPTLATDELKTGSQPARVHAFDAGGSGAATPGLLPPETDCGTSHDLPETDTPGNGIAPASVSAGWLPGLPALLGLLAYALTLRHVERRKHRARSASPAD